MALLQVEQLRVSFEDDAGNRTTAVDGISFSIEKGEVLAIVGESGSGKSVTALSLTRLIPEPPARYEGGRILWDQMDLMGVPAHVLRKIRGGKIAYIFQEPSTSLNPVMTIGWQIAEALQLHRPELKDPQPEVIALLDRVGIRDPSRTARAYPHELSGGMQQRAMIAMAVGCRPDLLVADEPTTALDVTIQAQILDMLRGLQKETGMSVLMITHNFAIVSELADRVVVMFRGQMVEEGPTRSVLQSPQHPYTRQLIACVPRLGARQRRLPVMDPEFTRSL